MDTGVTATARHPTIVTVPSYVRPGGTTGFATYTAGSNGGGQQVQVVRTPPQQAQQSTEAAALPQTITMPSGMQIINGEIFLIQTRMKTSLSSEALSQSGA